MAPRGPVVVPEGGVEAVGRIGEATAAEQPCPWRVQGFAAVRDCCHPLDPRVGVENLREVLLGRRIAMLPGRQIAVVVAAGAGRIDQPRESKLAVVPRVMGGRARAERRHEALRDQCRGRERRNSENIAQAIAGCNVRNLQAFITTGAWQDTAVLAEMRGCVLEALADDDAVCNYDETGFPKKARSARIGRQPAQSDATGLDLLHLGS